ncbi:GNAT family N-acetyltransferase [Paraburkholderia acidicola]|uniref:GNAT family N-acetyltransferase n=1 Tax=Paraburkholderia acidicola TaxID=1912599 RepID=A0ABV1LNH9_9BURK
MLIRNAEPSDAAEIEAVRVSAWQAAYTAFMPETYLANLDPTANVDSLNSRLKRQDSSFSCLVAERQGRVIGFSLVGSPRFPSNPSTAELWALYVAPNAWQDGVGTALLQRSLDLTSNQGFTTIKLWCIKGNAPAQRRYEAHGFAATGEERTTLALTGHPLHELCYSLNISSM